MSKFSTRPRSSVPAKFQWNLNKIYPTRSSWEAAYESALKRVPKLSAYRGKLKSSRLLKKFLNEFMAVQRLVEKVSVYAFYDFYADTLDPKKQQLYATAQKLGDLLTEKTAYFQPELLQLPAAILKKLVSARELQPYRRLLDQISHLKKHTLSLSEENLLGKLSSLQNSYREIFRAVDVSDLKFEAVSLSKTRKLPITHGSFIGLMSNPDRSLRQKVFRNYYRAYQDHLNTYASVLSSKIKQDNLIAEIRRYDSALEEALYPNNVSEKVYHRLIESAHQHLPVLYRYFDLRKKNLQLSKLNFWDLRVDLHHQKPLQFTYEEAVNIVCEALQPLGKDYLKVLRAGLLGGWVDRYENKGKTNGAFSGGSYDTDPYILTNFDGTLNSVFTLAHEAGHSLHSWYSRKKQPYQTAYYTMMVAETASTVNERLLVAYFYKKYQGTPYFKTIAQYEIDAIRSTFFRQTMFAEFELKIHRAAQSGEDLSAPLLSRVYADLLKKYHGPSVIVDPQIESEWARIMHFYSYNYYVYVYATGISAAYFITEKILSGAPKESRKMLVSYLNLLQSGGNDYPLAQLKKIGIDLTRPQIYNAIAKNLQKCLNLLK